MVVVEPGLLVVVGEVGPVVVTIGLLVVPEVVDAPLVVDVVGDTVVLGATQ